MKQILLFFALLFSLQVGAQMIHREAGGTPAQFTVTEYKTPGSYTYDVPAGCVALRAICIGGGGGAGSGRLGAASSNRSGGSGGWSGSVVDAIFLGFDLDSASYTVKVGAGGEGGAAQATNDTNGNLGTKGGVSAFSNLAQAPGGAQGNGGFNSFVTQPSSMDFVNDFGGADGILSLNNWTAGNGPGQGRTSASPLVMAFPQPLIGTTLGANLSYNLNSPAGGTGGSGVNASNIEADNSFYSGGGVHADTTATPLLTSDNFSLLITHGGQVGAAQTAGENGTDHVARYYRYTTTAGFGTGGGGGGGSNSTTIPAGDGGRGGHGGGGGAGGGGGTNGSASGAGGDGGDGVVIVIAFF